MGDNLTTLIASQFVTIDNEFESLITNLVYNEIKNTLADQNQQNLLAIKPVDQLIEIVQSNNVPNLFRYKANAWDNIGQTSQTTIKAVMKSLLDLLYLSNGGDFNLGDSIFRSQESRNAFKGLNADSLVSIENADQNGKQVIVKVYNEILQRLGNETYDFQKAISHMLASGNRFNLGFNVADAIKQSVQNVANGVRLSQVDDSSNVRSKYLDDIISGTNILIALTWKLKQVSLQPSNTFSSRNGQYALKDVVDAIKTIINTNSQFNSFELGDWSNIIINSKDFGPFTAALSGKDGAANFDQMVAGIINEENILAKRAEEVSTAALVQISNILKQLWWIIVVLIGAGILISSIVGVATKDSRIKLASRPVLKALLISAMILGAVVITLGILLGIPLI